MTDAMEAEFDLVAEWTRQAVRELGDDHALPAACQGSASPVARHRKAGTTRRAGSAS